MGPFATLMGPFATVSRDTSGEHGTFAVEVDHCVSLFLMLQLCENMRREGNYAKTCGFNRNMRFHVEKLKICDLMRKIQKYAVSHVPHLNRVLGLQLL